jgi:transposase
MKTCGLDVHKGTIFCAIYNGKSYSEVKEFSTMTPEIRKMGDYLRSEGVKRVAMESTATYWIPVWDILYEQEFDLMLVNPYLVKQMPGRKSDVKDAQWLACLLHKGMLRGSFVPPPLIQELRCYSRTYSKLKQRQTRNLNNMDRILTGCGIRISSCLEKMSSKSVQKVVLAIIAGERDADKLSKLVYANKVNKASGKLRQALTGTIKPHQVMVLKIEKQEYDLHTQHQEECLKEMHRICSEHFAQELALLKTIPGISSVSAMIILAEIGGDMSVFENSGKLSGWAGLRPRNDESAGKYKSRAITKGNKYLRAILAQCGWAASRTKGSFFKEFFNRLCMRKSSKKAVVALARKLLVVIWNVLHNKKPYNPQLVQIYDPIKLENRLKYYQKEMEKVQKLLQ